MRTRRMTLRGARIESLLASLPADAEGELRVHSERGVDRVLLRAGRVVGVDLRAHFDPLLDRLQRSGELDPTRYHRALTRLAISERRSGELAAALGVPKAAVQEALAQQMRQRLAVLERRVRSGAKVTFRSRNVASGEVVQVMPRVSQPSPKRSDNVVVPMNGEANRQRARERRARPRGTTERCVTRQQLVSAAMRLHPDRNPNATPAERRKLQDELARLTAAYHGL